MLDPYQITVNSVDRTTTLTDISRNLNPSRHHTNLKTKRADIETPKRGVDPQRSWTIIVRQYNEYKTYQFCSNAVYDNWCMGFIDYKELKEEFVKFPLPDVPQRYNKMVELATLFFLPVIIRELLEPFYEKIEVSCNYFPSTGPDIIVFSKDSLLLKMEVLNWWIQSYLSEGRASGIKDNLKGARYKVLYVTSDKNLTTWTMNSKLLSGLKKALKGVNIYYSRYQILPITYFDYLFKIDYRFAKDRAIFNEKTIKHQKIRLKRFFEQIGIIPLVKR